MDTENNVNIDTSNDTETTSETVDTLTETESDNVELTLEETNSEVDVAKLQEINKKLFARAKKAEEALKKQKPQASVQPKGQINNREQDYLSREEAILIAKGLDEQALDALKVISKGKNVSLLEAQKDPMFAAFNSTIEEQNRKAKAKLSASKGSGLQRAEKSISSMTREEHEALVRKSFSN